MDGLNVRWHVDEPTWLYSDLNGTLMYDNGRICFRPSICDENSAFVYQHEGHEEGDGWDERTELDDFLNGFKIK